MTKKLIIFLIIFLGSVFLTYKNVNAQTCTCVQDVVGVCHPPTTTNTCGSGLIPQCSSTCTSCTCILMPAGPNDCGRNNNVCCPGNACDPGLICFSSTTGTGSTTPMCREPGWFAPSGLPIPVTQVDVGCNINNGVTGVNTALGCIPTGDLNDFASWALTRAIGLAGGIAFLLMAFGAFKIITAGGDPNNVKAGSELITAALSGLLFIILSALLLKIIGVDILKIPEF